MVGGVVAVREAAGGLDHVIHAQVAPGKVLRVLHGQDLDGPTVDDQVVVLRFNRDIQRAVDRIVLDQVGEGLGVGQVVDRDEFQGRIAQGRAQYVAPDAAEPVDADADCHGRQAPSSSGERTSTRILCEWSRGVNPTYVPMSHDARYFSCSFVSRSMPTPMAASLSRAISLSMAAGTG